MTMARAQLVDVSLARWYRCVTRCVRRAFLLGEGDQNREECLENRIEELAVIFAVAVGGFSAMDNHFASACSRSDQPSVACPCNFPNLSFQLCASCCVTARHINMTKSRQSPE